MTLDEFDMDVEALTADRDKVITAVSQEIITQHRELLLGRDREMKHLILSILIADYKLKTRKTYEEISNDYGRLSAEMLKSLYLRRAYLSPEKFVDLYEYLLKKYAQAIITDLVAKHVSNI